MNSKENSLVFIKKAKALIFKGFLFFDGFYLEVSGGFEPPYTVLQTAA